MFAYLCKGLIVGLAVAVPIGPVGLLCLENTVTRGRRAGLSCAGGMVTADIFSSCLMLLGFGLFYDTLMAHELVFRLVTGLIFMGMGVVLFVTRHRPVKEASGQALAGLGLSSFLLSVSPATFAMMLFLFPVLELTSGGPSIPVVAGVALGSAVWASVILGAGGFIRSCLGDRLPAFKTVIACLFLFAGLAGILVNLLSSH